MKKYKIYDEIWQEFSTILPLKKVGAIGDNRTYKNVYCLRVFTISRWYDCKIDAQVWERHGEATNHETNTSEAFAATDCDSRRHIDKERALHTQHPHAIQSWAGAD